MTLAAPVVRTRRRPDAPAGPLRVLFPYDGATFGGSHVSSLLLANALKAQGHEPLVVQHGSGRAGLEASVSGLALHTLPPLWRNAPARGADRARVEQALAWPAALRTLLRLRPQVVHINDLAMLRVWGPPARIAGVRLVKHWRSNYRPSASVDLGLRCAHSIIAVSHSAREQLPAWAQAKTVVEYNPFRAEAPADAGQRRAAKVALGLSPDCWLLGVFGALSERKRPFVLAEVLGRLGAELQGRPIFGLAAGAPFEPTDPRLAAALDSHQLHARLLRPGFVSPVQAWMSACDVILAPAVSEPFGRTPLEAIACGVPVILSDDCGAAEILTDGRDAIILPPEPIDAWAAAASRVLTTPELASALVRSGREALGELAPESHARRIVAHYRALLAKTASMETPR